MNDFNGLDELACKIKNDLSITPNRKKVVLLYAFNGTGKTRLSTHINNEDDSKSLTYGVFFEDQFYWDNKNYSLRFSKYSKIISFIIDQGLENQITDNFQKFIEFKIQPNFDFDDEKITFSYTPGDDRSEANIKISRGEESVFIWSIYFTVLEAIISVLNEPNEYRSTSDYNDLEYVIIDDPVSSIDESKIVTMTIELIQVIDSLKNCNLRFLVTTHHPLFYNIMFNEYSKKKDFTTIAYSLSKTNSTLRLEKQQDTPFGYHLLIKEKISDALNNGELEKYHFNLFRSLLEKTSTFLGYKNWYDCLDTVNKKKVTKLVNLYSHGKLSDLESKSFPEADKTLFKDVFEEFIVNYKWNTH